MEHSGTFFVSSSDTQTWAFASDGCSGSSLRILCPFFVNGCGTNYFLFFLPQQVREHFSPINLSAPAENLIENLRN